ncbi:hypothetical protein DPMN_147427 [Dreissena polymorpha]|uniref:Uncharacterized protein n=1 Tax=Dreissena polymorpha TaxID=45954 RepID=A0A9D4F908_DREPO|nr:hypothetical protein DPMN_147427 [Dreissena polymorpha]
MLTHCHRDQSRWYHAQTALIAHADDKLSTVEQLHGGNTSDTQSIKEQLKTRSRLSERKPTDGSCKPLCCIGQEAHRHTVRGGSFNYNNKDYHFIILKALVAANNEFIRTEVGSKYSAGYTKAFNNSGLKRTIYTQG